MDATRRSRYGWMALGALICLGTVGLLLKMRDGNRAYAQNPEPPKVTVEPPPVPPLPPAGLPGEPPTALPMPAPSDATPPAGAALPTLKPVRHEEPVAPPGLVQPPVNPPPIEPTGTTPVTPPMATPPMATSPMATSPSSPPLAPPTLAPPPPPGRVGTESSPIIIPGTPPPSPVDLPKVPEPSKVPETPKALETPKTPDLVPMTPAPFKEPAKEPIKRVTGTLESATNSSENLQPLPTIRPRPTPKPKAVLPLTGTAVTTLTARTLVLPANVREQLGNCDTVLVSPGSSRCLWITNQAHLDRLGEKLEKSPAREDDIQAFKRLYYAQIVKLPVRDARVTLTDRLAEFAGLTPDAEVVLVGIDDHFELWDATTWRKFAATRKADAND